MTGVVKSLYDTTLGPGETAELALAFALLDTAWPSDAELDAVMLEDCATEDMPVRNSDYTQAHSMSPAEIVRASRITWESDIDLQIAALQRLTLACETLRWPDYVPSDDYEDGLPIFGRWY